MELAAAKKIVNDHVGWLRWALCLNHWQITIVYKRLSANEKNVTLGRCDTNRRYWQATISLDNEEFESEEQLLGVLRHEMLHIFHASFESYRQMVAEHIVGVDFAAMDVAFQDAMEATVGHIERMLDAGLGLEPKAFISKARAHGKKSR